MPKAARREGVTHRVTRLEGRVNHLEDRVSGLEQTPGQDPTPTPIIEQSPARPESPRCPGCHLEIASRRHRSCEWCGFILSEGR